MTHTLHWMGSKESFAKDIVMINMSAKGFNTSGSMQYKKDFIDIALRNGAINIGEGVRLFLPLNRMGKDAEFFSHLKDEVNDNSIPMVVFNERSNAFSTLKNLKESRNPLSLVISGDTELVRDILNDDGLAMKPFAVESRVLRNDDDTGVFGKSSLLPQKDVVEINSLCGHGMVSYSLIQRVMMDVKLGRINAETGSRILERPCSCCVFNRKRAEEVLERHRSRDSDV